MPKFGLEHPGDLGEGGVWPTGEAFVSPLGEDAPSTLVSVFLVLVFSFVFLAASLLNTFFLIIFMRKPSLRNISNRFIVSLTVSNLVTAWVLLPLVVADIFLKSGSLLRGADTPEGVAPSSAALCIAFNIAADFATSASVFSTVVIALDRFFAITDPLHYHMLVTKWRSWGLISLGWLLAGVVAFVSGVVGDGEGKWNVCESRPLSPGEISYWGHVCFGAGCFVVCFALPLVLLAWAYARIYEAAQQNSERARRSSLCSPSLEVVDAAKSVSRSSSTRSASSQIVSTIRRRLSNASLFLYKEEARAAKISVGVVVLFLLCWFPYYLTKVVYAAFAQATLPMYVFKLVLVSTLLNSAVSPYVYMYRSKRIQREVLRLFGFSAKKRRRTDCCQRRRPIYRQLLSANLERIPASPLGGLDGTFKLDSESSSFQDAIPHRHGRSSPVAKQAPSTKHLCKKIFHPSVWRPSFLFPSSCLSSSPKAVASLSSSTGSSSYQPSSCISTASTQTLTNFLPPTINVPIV